MVSIDSVYQRVLAFANKEQRGYITPQEFNLFAEQAQLEIFEQYFYDLNQYSRADNSSEEYSDIIHNINEKIAIFEATSSIHSSGKMEMTDLWRLGTVIVNGTTEAEEVQQNDILYMNQSPLTLPTLNRPVYVRESFNNIQVYPTTTSLSCTYIRKPKKPHWGYFVVGNKALHDVSLPATTNFELHPSEESELIYKILKFTGVSMAKPDVLQAAQIQEQAQIQQEKI